MAVPNYSIPKTLTRFINSKVVSMRNVLEGRDKTYPLRGVYYAITTVKASVERAKLSTKQYDPAAGVSYSDAEEIENVEITDIQLCRRYLHDQYSKQGETWYLKLEEGFIMIDPQIAMDIIRKYTLAPGGKIQGHPVLVLTRQKNQIVPVLKDTPEWTKFLTNKAEYELAIKEKRTSRISIRRLIPGNKYRTTSGLVGFYVGRTTTGKFVFFEQGWRLRSDWQMDFRPIKSQYGTSLTMDARNCHDNYHMRKNYSYVHDDGPSGISAQEWRMFFRDSVWGRYRRLQQRAEELEKMDPAEELSTSRRRNSLYGHSRIQNTVKAELQSIRESIVIREQHAREIAPVHIR